MDANISLSHTSEVVMNQSVKKRSKKKTIVLDLTKLLNRIITTQEDKQYDKANDFFKEQGATLKAHYPTVSFYFLPRHKSYC